MRTSLLPLSTSKSHILDQGLAIEILAMPKRANTLPKVDFSKRCWYHRNRGHLTKECSILKDKVENLIKLGYLWILSTSSILAPTSIGFGSSLSLFKVIALTFPFGLIIGYVGILPEPYCCNWLTIVANCPIWVYRFLLATLTFYWNKMLLVAICFINSSKEGPKLLFCTGCAGGGV